MNDDTELDLPVSRKRGRESKYGDADGGNERKQKQHRSTAYDIGARYDEDQQRDFDLERELKVGHRAQMLPPTDDPIGASFDRKATGLADTLSVGAGISRPFGSALRAGRGPLPPSGAGAARVGGGMDVDPITGMYPQDRRARVVHSTGRDAPAAPQSNIVGTVVVAKNIYDKRSKVPDDDAIAPLGTEEDFRIMQGEWCFMVAEQGMPNRQSVLQDTDIEVVSCVNGKSRYDRLQFVGNMQGKGSNPADPRSDDHATVQFAGVMSGINTGLDPIPPFVPVHFREDPATIVNSSGHLVPAIAENGQPVTKFRPASYPYTEEIVQASVTRLQNLVDKDWDSVVGASADGSAVDTSAGVLPADGDGVRQRNFWQLVNTHIDDHFRQPQWGSEDHPLKVYARWYAISCMLNLVNTNVVLANPGANNAADAALIFSRFFEVVRAMKDAIALQQRNKHIRDYNSIVGHPMSGFRRSGLQDLLLSNGMISDAMLGRHPAGALGVWTGNSRMIVCQNSTFPRLKQYISEYIATQMVQGTQEQHYKNRLSFGGISLKLAQAGKPLDLLKGTNF